MTEETLILLGTGNATVTRCFNTCFAIRTEEAEYFLVDTGGGNGIMTQLERAQIPMEQIHEIFMSHEHTDHLLGLIWMIRMIATKMKKGQYEGNLNIYCHSDLKDVILTITKLTVQEKFFRLIGERIFLCPVEDGEEREILGYRVKFFDIRSTKAKQFGFTMKLKNGKRFTFLGDEPYQEHERAYAQDSDWLLHEAFCLYQDREIYKPYEKHHTTVREACENGESLGAKNLILYHTEDRNLRERRARYTAEGERYYHGNLLVPDDLEKIIL
ncbi:MAG: MBL fold metallo-hydrolase [Eubacteriales bacterium]|nr:MBL fold metallo-hydrolase [Eubacteriales bacterium]